MITVTILIDYDAPNYMQIRYLLIEKAQTNQGELMNSRDAHNMEQAIEAGMAEDSVYFDFGFKTADSSVDFLCSLEPNTYIKFKGIKRDDGYSLGSPSD